MLRLPSCGPACDLSADLQTPGLSWIWVPDANRVHIAAGWVMLLSSAYRIWAVWRFDMRMPFPVFGTADRPEADNFLRVKVHQGCRCNAACLMIVSLIYVES